MENEIFCDIEGFENLYQISNLGRVYSLIRGKFLKTCKDKDNYRQITLHKDGKIKNYRIHRLVALAFIPNPLNLPEVNHRDENPSNNRVENLEWCDRKYNNNYGTRTEKCSKPVLQFTREGKFIKEYPSLIEAERQTKIFNQNISSCCLGKRKSCGGFVWRYKNAS
jgi:hypothetical protein